MQAYLTHPALVIERGQLRSLRASSWTAMNVQTECEPELEILLCLLDGAERRRRLLKRLLEKKD
jgi:hypothetical protein